MELQHCSMVMLHYGNVAYYIFVALLDSLNCFVEVVFSYIWIGFVLFSNMSRVMLGYYIHLGLGLCWILPFFHGYVVLWLCFLMYFVGL